ncbi:hypothetical protein LIER_13700 [Lithospermum erythrorhizon]|uniref:Uncharacterized protein n=1 Tax=Lithospermum erythrorhizon TaxID=34254 RepID=A0AAV3Q0K0_LITER
MALVTLSQSGSITSGMEHNCSNIIIQVLIIFFSAIIMSIVNGRELRPSDHGLGYQDSSSTPEMQTFFNGQTPKPLPLAAKNVTEWWRSEGGKDKQSPSDARNSNGRGDHVRVNPYFLLE